MDLSLIVPCHNVENLIGNLINSLNKQKNDLGIKREVIFGLDNCTDNSEEVIRKNLKNWDYKIIKCSNSLVGPTRNDCLEEASGEYIMFADADDWYLEDDVTDVLYKCIKENNYDIVEFKIKSHIQKIGQYGMAAVWRAIYSRKIIGDTKFVDNIFGEDNQFSEEIWQKCGVENGGWGMPEYKENPYWYQIDYTPYFYNYPRENSLMDLKYDVWKKYKQGVM